LSAEQKLILKAREKAQREKTTLNAVFRQWLRQYVNSDYRTKEFDHLIKSFSYAKPGRTFSRDEMNER